MVAMAAINSPAVIFADEPTTALDVTIQAQVLSVLKDRVDTLGCGLVLITHDLGVVAQVADRIAVMYAGRIVEEGDVRDVYENPEHHYTRALLASIPRFGMHKQRLVSISGRPPSVHDRPTGCAFHPRCPVGADRALCRDEVPSLEPVQSGHMVACHFPASALREGLE